MQKIFTHSTLKKLDVRHYLNYNISHKIYFYGETSR